MKILERIKYRMHPELKYKSSRYAKDYEDIAEKYSTTPNIIQRIAHCPEMARKFDVRIIEELRMRNIIRLSPTVAAMITGIAK